MLNVTDYLWCEFSLQYTFASLFLLGFGSYRLWQEIHEQSWLVWQWLTSQFGQLRFVMEEILTSIQKERLKITLSSLASVETSSICETRQLIHNNLDLKSKHLKLSGQIIRKQEHGSEGDQSLWTTSTMDYFTSYPLHPPHCFTLQRRAETAHWQNLKGHFPLPHRDFPSLEMCSAKRMESIYKRASLLWGASSSRGISSVWNGEIFLNQGTSPEIHLNMRYSCKTWLASHKSSVRGITSDNIMLKVAHGITVE